MLKNKRNHRPLELLVFGIVHMDLNK